VQRPTQSARGAARQPPITGGQDLVPSAEAGQRKRHPRDARKVGPAPHEPAHPPEHGEARQQGPAAGHLGEHSQTFFVQPQRGGKAPDEALRFGRWGALDQRRDHGQLNGPFSAVRVNHHARDFVERDGLERVGRYLHLVDARDALDQRALGFGETTVCAGDTPKGAQNDRELLGCEHFDIHGPD
jgi:hypothetical protein